jgi:hypothetical protein
MNELNKIDFAPLTGIPLRCCLCGGLMIKVSEIIETTGSKRLVERVVCSDRKTTGCK